MPRADSVANRRCPITLFRAIVAAALAAIAIASLSTPGAASASVPDAYCGGPTDNVVGSGGSGVRFAETFSPINGGYLTEVRFFIQKESGGGADYLVQITPVNPSNLAPVDPVVVLAQATIPASSVPVNPTYPYLSEVAADFSTPPAVLASSEYAIVVKRPGNTGVLGLGIKTNNSPGGDPCPDGAFYHSGDDSSPWSAADTHHDVVFSTFVTGASTPPPPPPRASRTGRRAAALKKCKKKHSRKAKRKCRKRANRLPV